MEILVLFGCVLALVLIDIPIAVALGIVAVVAAIVTHGTQSLPNLPLELYNGATNFPLIAIPLFIMAGAIMNASGISQRLIAFASAILGFIRGGLAMVSIGASMFFAEISGSAVADVSALGSILIPAMKSKGYPSPLAAMCWRPERSKSKARRRSCSTTKRCAPRIWAVTPRDDQCSAMQGAIPFCSGIIRALSGGH